MNFSWLLHLPMIGPFLLWNRKRRENKRKQRNYENLYHWVLNKVEEHHERTSLETSCDSRAMQKTLSYYPEWGCFSKGGFLVVILYPLVFCYDFILTIEEYEDLFTLILTRDPESHSDRNKKHLIKALKSLTRKNKSLDWVAKDPEGITKDVVVDYLNSFKSRYYENLRIEREKSLPEKLKRIESQKDFLNSNLKTFETLQCPRCHHRHILNKELDRSPYVLCTSCDEDLVYLPSKLEFLNSKISECANPIRVVDE